MFCIRYSRLCRANLKEYGHLTDSDPIRIYYVNEIKIWINLECIIVTRETWKLLGSTKSKVTKNENDVKCLI